MKSSNTPYYIILGIVGALLIVSVSFWGGMEYQKKHGATTVAVSGGAPNGGFTGGGGMMRGGTFGTVESINGTSMTVNNTRTGTRVKVSLANNPTIITGNAATGSLSDITAGSTVVVRGTADANGVVQATSVRVNPSFNGAPPAAGSGSPSTSGGI